MKTNKKAISEVVSYTILVIIAIGLSIFVYQYLKGNIKDSGEVCPDSVYISIDAVLCNFTSAPGIPPTFGIVLTNRGFFNISGAHVRIAHEGASVKRQINNSQVLFPGGPLAPGNAVQYYYNTAINPPGNIINQVGPYVVEVQPVLLSKKKKFVLCSSVVTQPFVCT